MARECPVLMSNTATSHTRANSSGLSKTSRPADHRPMRPCRLLDRVLAEMLQGATEMLLGEGPQMAVTVEGFLTCAHAVSLAFLAPSQPCRRRRPSSLAGAARQNQSC